jgi:methyl-accepting chemotaxis protein
LSIVLNVSEIQKAINTTVMVTEEGTKTVRTGVQTARQTEEVFSGVENAANLVVFNNQQVSLNLKQQSDAMRQIVDAMDEINQGAKEAAIGLTETKEGTRQLNTAALVLQELV